MDIKNILDKGKRTLDSLLFGVGANFLALGTGNIILNEISKGINDNYEGAIMSAAKIAGGAGLYYLNKKMIIPQSKKIYNKSNKNSLRFNSIATGVMTGYMLLTGSFADYAKDIKNLLNANSRQVEVKLEKSEGASLENIKEKVPTGYLAGMKGFDYKLFLGCKDSIEIPEKLTINPRKTLIDQWEIKLDKYKNHKFAKVLNEFYDKEIKNFSNKDITSMNLNQYIQYTQNNVETVRDNINWKIAAKYSGINENSKEDISLLKETCKKVNAQEMVSYILTELMPSKIDGKQNLETFKFIIKNYGIEGLNRIPARHDPYLSYGPYQLTSKAIKNIPNNWTEKGQVTKINYALPERLRVPGSMISMCDDPDNMPKAGYMNAIYNLGHLIGKLTSKQKKVFRENLDNIDFLVKYIAAAHNNPQSAIWSAKCFLDNEAKSDYLISCNSLIRSYVAKTDTNYKALKGMQ